MKKALLLGLAALTLSAPSLAQTKKAPADSAASKSGKAKSKSKSKSKPMQAQVDEIFKQVAEIVADKLGVMPDKVSPSAKLVEDLGADDLGLIELVMAIGDAFQIDITDKDVTSFKTVADVAAYVRANQ